MTNKIMPKLRFKGFNKVWYPKDIAQLGTVITGNTPPKKDKSNYSSNGISWITPTDISNETINDTNEKLSIKGSRKSRLVPKNSILITCIGNSIGGKVLTSRTTGFNQQINALVPKNNDSYFLYSRFSLFGKIINMFSSQGTMPIIKKSAFAKITFYIPSLPEQQLIGKFFAKLDKLIQLQQKKVTLLKKLKRGYLQKLFPRKGESVPRVRFKGFHDKWTKHIINDLIKMGKSGGTPSKSHKEYYGGNIPFLSINDVTSSNGIINKTTKFITQTGLDNSSAWIVPKGSLILSMYASVGEIAKSDIKLSTSQAFFDMVFNSTVILNMMYYVFQYIKFQHRWRPFINTGTQGNLNAHTIRNFQVLLPSIKEQKLIYRFLNNIDVRIKSQNNKLIQLRKLKKAYLQKMFC